jgi:hypothetical protein
MVGTKETTMDRPPQSGSRILRRSWRWAARIGLLLLLAEVAYVIVGNLVLRAGILENSFNQQPEEDFVSWQSASTLLPGLVSFKEFTYRGQTLGGQVWLHLETVDARISLRRLASKTLDIGRLDATNIDYRYRDRIDYPCWSEDSRHPFPGIPGDLEFYPEIPGLENPPHPKPEDLYDQEKDPRPWKILISGADVHGFVRVAYNGYRLEGEGSVAGGLTTVLKETSAIDRARVRLVPGTFVWGSHVITDDFDLDLDVRVKPFPAVCSELSEIVAGTSGRVTVAGRNSGGFTVHLDAFASMLPRQGLFSIESGTGELGGHLEVDDGKLTNGRLDLIADDVILKREDIPLHGDLEVHATFAEGDLTTNRFDLSGTTVRLDDVAKSGMSDKHREKLEPWFGILDFEKGMVSFGRPMALESHVRLRMHDTRPVLALLRQFTDQLEWLPLTRNAKGIEGSVDLEFGEGFLTFDNLELIGENVEILGWIHVRDEKRTGRIFARHGLRSAGVAFDGGQGKVVAIGSRRWFDKQSDPASNHDNPDPPPDDSR